MAIHYLPQYIPIGYRSSNVADNTKNSYQQLVNTTEIWDQSKSTVQTGQGIVGFAGYLVPKDYTDYAIKLLWDNDGRTPYCKVQFYYKDELKATYQDWGNYGYDDNYTCVNISQGYTSNGVGLAFYVTKDRLSSNNNPFNNHEFNYYLCKYTSLDKTTDLALVHVNTNGSYSIATSTGTSSEPVLSTIADSTRGAYMFPVVNTNTGDIFNKLYAMKRTPVQYNTMRVSNLGTYMCGKNLCIAD